MYISIRSKLAVIATASLGICASLVFLFSVNEYRDLYRESVETNLEAVSANMADDLLFTMAMDFDEFSIAAELLEFERYSLIKYAQVFNPNWQLISQYIRPDLQNNAANTGISIPDPRALPFAISVVDATLVNLKPIGEAGYPVGYLLVVQDFINPLEASRLTFFSRVAPVVALTMVATILASWWAYRHLLEPVIQLSRFTRQVEDTKDYQMQIQVAGNDEVTQLAHDINNMLKTIDRENKVNIEQNKKLLQQQSSMQRMVEYDLLTDLPNRTCFMKLLENSLTECAEKNIDLAILFFDVDGFKEVNDSFGHEAGDALLVEVSRIVKSCLRPTDTLARLGGDEFLIMLPGLDQPKVAEAVAKRILNLLVEPIHVNGWDIQSGVSIGIAHAKDVAYQQKRLVANADLAMYVSKEQGKTTYTAFHPTMLEHKQRKIKVANLIPLALRKHEFSLHYQLKVSSTGKANGAEALLRWHNPALGFISPGEFIPIAEKSGKIHAITEWVILQVFKDLPKLINVCGDDFIVSLNVSSHDLEDINFIDTIRRAIFEQNVDISKIQFEITESSYLDNFERANKFFSEIDQMGGSIALDDFGTGYSSLSYLTRIRIDTLKIDRMFVSQFENSNRDAAILQTIIDLAHRVGLKTCSEGIETADQARYVLNQGCHQLQGFLFAKPEPLEKLDKTYVKNVERTFQEKVIGSDINAGDLKLNRQRYKG